MDIAVLFLSVSFVAAISVPALARHPPRARIVGGVETDIGHSPHQVSMEKLHTDSQSWLHECGGSILSTRHILSAAYCVTAEDSQKIGPSQIRFRAGSSTLQDGGDVYECESLWPHPQYRGRSGKGDYDVAVFKVNRDITLSDKVNTIRITAEGSEPKVGERLLMTGWGLEDYTNFEYSTTLMVVSTVSTSRASCAVSKGNLTLTERMICSASPGRGSCLVSEARTEQGDSGGPLSNYLGEQVGIMSHGSMGVGCARPGIPVVHTNLANQEIRNFINGKLLL